MKAISLWQPWASAIPAGLKSIETRHWPAPPRLIGQVIAIHAAKRWTRDEKEFWEERVLGRPTYETAFHKIGVQFGHELPKGAIVATARLYGCRFTNDLLNAGVASAQEQDWGNFSYGRYGWLLQDVTPITPVPFLGHQGFFDWTP